MTGQQGGRGRVSGETSVRLATPRSLPARLWRVFKKSAASRKASHSPCRPFKGRRQGLEVRKDPANVEQPCVSVLVVAAGQVAVAGAKNLTAGKYASNSATPAHREHSLFPRLTLPTSDPYPVE